MVLLDAMLLLLVACIGCALVARLLHLPYAAVLVVGGMVIALIPGLPHVRLDPELALAFFLPPLLQASAWRTDWNAFRENLRPILLLALGAVLFTAACVALVLKGLVPDLPWPAAVALGALVAPPDAVAASAVLQRLRIPARIVTVLEGESLINDASSLVLYRAALGALAAGGVSWGQASLSFLLVSLGGVAVGWASGRAAAWVVARLNDTLLETSLSFLVSFVIYAAAEALGVSGVIAVVTGGFVVVRRARDRLSAETRVQLTAVWTFAEFLLTSFVFILMGLQLNGILDRLPGRSWPDLLGLTLAVSLTVILARFLWVFPTNWIPRSLPPLAHHSPAPRAAHVTVVAWAGMRGVVSLAAALALPATMPERELLVFLAFGTILATLVVQGTTLGWLIRALDVEEPPRAGMPPAEAMARRIVTHAERQALEERIDSPIDGAIARDLLPPYRDIERVYDNVASGASRAELTARLQLRLMALRAGRSALLTYHSAQPLPERTLTALAGELDHEELRLRHLLTAAS
ncbi:Na+/H+ antiporter [Roseomonas sp. OT10]|uniref:Na+/H+ antiporter n=1 Tax=Roseomonas cutis TaxID=2897332 RepID=UPI001E4A2308|nr:Na+/H+ antiporter [Roseomonas sp. OT10]UFN50616.1 Na+/H+ antiporter [Roseomonas sp. OT10]